MKNNFHRPVTWGKLRHNYNSTDLYIFSRHNKNYYRKYKIGNLQGCFTFYRASSLNTFQNIEPWSCRSLLRFFILLHFFLPRSSLYLCGTLSFSSLLYLLILYNHLLLHIEKQKLFYLLTLKNVITFLH